MQYLIGLGLPISVGIGLSDKRDFNAPTSVFKGVQAKASAIHAASCASSFLPLGRSMMFNVPRKSPAMYSAVFCPGCGPCGFARDEIPFPFATNKCLPSGVTRTLVGYQPTGMKPRERLLPGLLTSNTATTFTFALATNKVFSSGDNARLFGVAPGGDCG